MKDKATFQNKVKVLNKLFDSGCDTEKKLQQLDMEAILKSCFVFHENTSLANVDYNRKRWRAECLKS